MLDSKLIKSDPDLVAQKLKQRGLSAAFDEFLNMDTVRRRLLVEVEEKKSFRNRTSQEIGKMKKVGQEPIELMNKVKEIGQEIKEIDDQLLSLEQKMKDILLTLPNLPHDSAPIGGGETDNVEVRRWGDLPEFDFAPLPHWDIGTG
ncbi:MAG: serine--tRNA ligase, partial [Syntrophomonadaceae bacterium]|nr:serine--tRNA ligase [Syntrophomonadaceae bacterium]